MGRFLIGRKRRGCYRAKLLAGDAARVLKGLTGSPDRPGSWSRENPLLKIEIQLMRTTSKQPAIPVKNTISRIRKNQGVG